MGWERSKEGGWGISPGLSCLVNWFRLLKFSLCAGKFVSKPLVKTLMQISPGVQLQGLKKPRVCVKYGNGHLV